ncbi:MAG: hypothetical protein ABIR81_06370 [Ginsengibacter sp.]
MNNVALLVHACDRYKFLYPGFAFFFKKYWDFTIPCNYYFATEEADVGVDHFKNIKSGKGQWSDRLRKLLIKNITEDYVLYFQEDMWLKSVVDADFFKELFIITQSENWQLVKLHSSNVYQTTATQQYIQGLNVTVLNNKLSGYLMSHQVTLWHKPFLIEQLYKNEHPWRNERRGTKRLKKLDPVIQHIDYFADNGSIPINQNKNIYSRSAYNTVSLNGMFNDNVLPYIPQLLEGDNWERGFALRYEDHYHKKITHDGLPKPRKEDVFKKIKNMFTK